MNREDVKDIIGAILFSLALLFIYFCGFVQGAKILWWK